jgi:uncharacterized membrane protein YeaQ/YmgE (transglycosylase-associated protein family)
MGLDLLGWIIVGFIAGSVSGWFVKDRTAQGCLPTIVVGILGGVVGGWLAREMGFGGPQGLLGAIVVATLGALLVRIVLQAVNRR